MIGKIARIAFLFILAIMIAAWAIAAVKDEPESQTNEEPIWIVFT
jgi:hypothetical protein